MDYYDKYAILQYFCADNLQMLQIQNNRICKFHWLIYLRLNDWLASVFPLAYVFRFVFDGVLNEKNINVCLFIFFQLKTIFLNKNKSDNSVKNPAHPERSRSEFEAFSYSTILFQYCAVLHSHENAL